MTGKQYTPLEERERIIKTMLIDGIEVTEDMRRVVEVPRSVGEPMPGSNVRFGDHDPNVVEVVFEAAEHNPDGTFKTGHKHVFTTSNAKDMQARGNLAKKAKKVTKLREALLREVQAVAPPDYVIETWEDAWAFMGGLITSRGIDTHAKLNDAVRVFNAIGKATDAFPDKTPLSIRDGKQAISGSADEVFNLLMQARRDKESE